MFNIEDDRKPYAEQTPHLGECGMRAIKPHSTVRLVTGVLGGVASVTSPDG